MEANGSEWKRMKATGNAQMLETVENMCQRVCTVYWRLSSERTTYRVKLPANSVERERKREREKLGTGEK